MSKNTSNKPPYVSNPFAISFEAFSRFFNINQGWAILVIILSFVGFIGQVISNIPNSTNTSPSETNLAASNPDTTTLIALVVVIATFTILTVFIASLIGTYLKGMFSYVALQSEKGITVTFSDAAKQTNQRFWKLYLAELLATLKIIGWSLLFIIPGIIAAYRYRLLAYVIMDEEAGALRVAQTHARVKEIVKNRLIEVFGLSTVANIVPVAGSLLGLAGNAALYRQLQVFTDNKLEKPTKHWLNYLGFILAIVLILILLLIGLIILVTALNR